MVALDPQIRAFLSEVDLLEGESRMDAADDGDASATRRLFLERVARLARRSFPVRVATEDHFVTLPGREVALRLYRTAGGSDEAAPVLIYLHGGGWVGGSIATHDVLCAEIADRTDAAVASVQYRRAPENPHPAQHEDCWNALGWLARHAPVLGLDPSRWALGGDSAGAHLAIGCALRSVRERRRPAPSFLLLFYPVIAPDFETPSYREFAQAPGSPSREMMRFYWTAFLGGAEPPGADAGQHASSSAVPALAVPALAGDDALGGLPATYLATAEIDPLRDEGEAFGRRLTRLGVPLVFRRAATLPHGFARLLQISDAADREVTQACVHLRRALAARARAAVVS